MSAKNGAGGDSFRDACRKVRLQTLGIKPSTFQLGEEPTLTTNAYSTHSAPQN